MLQNVEDHLILLQEKRRQQQQLREKDKKHDELQQKEKGFMLYVNGANAEIPPVGNKTSRTARPKSCRQKATNPSMADGDDASRAKTAPTARMRRRQWQAASVEIKTAAGNNVRIKAPVTATGNYDDDFDDDDDDDDDISQDAGKVSDLEEIDEDTDATEMESDARSVSSSVDEEITNDERDDVDVFKSVLRCSRSDARKLRKSLEMSSSLRLANPRSVTTNPNRSSSDHRAVVASSSDRADLKPLDSSCGNIGENMESLLDKILHLDIKSQQEILRVLRRADNVKVRQSTAWTEATPTSVRNSQSVNSLRSLADQRAELSASHSDSNIQSRDLDSGKDEANVHSNDERSQRRTKTRNSRRQHRDTSDGGGAKNIPTLSSHGPVIDRVSASKLLSRGENQTSDTVKLELLSNWGHETRVGLTEIELLDADGRRVDVSMSDVSVKSANGTLNVDNLFNSKCKTVRDRYMWSSDVTCLPVGIVIRTSRPLSAVRLWNYNHTQQDLSAGVRGVRLLYNDSEVFRGDISKGCANQIFDYSQLIRITADQTRRSKSGTESIFASFSSVTSETPETSQPTSARHRRRNRVTNSCDKSAGVDRMSLQLTEDMSVFSPRPLPLTTSSSATTAPAVEHNRNRGDTETSVSGAAPPWLHAKESRTHDEDGTRFPSSADRSTVDPVSDKSTRNSRDVCRLSLVNIPSSNTDSDTSCLSKHDLEQFDDDHVPPMKKIETARSLRRQRQEFSLEESWSSLNVFNQTQKGRISLDIQDDALDEYLAGIDSSRPSHPPPSSSAAIDKSSPRSDDGDFVIPELPRGQHMVINITSTWGDRHYVGLSGIEIFADNGLPVTVCKISAEPSDINVLPEYGRDPRVVTNLIDGVNRTQDDTHMWLAPFTSGQPHYVYVAFDQPATISVLRIWNYNKSRIHSSRGAKNVEISLDGTVIFIGEIARASGGVIGTSESFGDTILFTMDDEILERVADNDLAFEVDAMEDLCELDDEVCDRPSTADGERTDIADKSVSQALTTDKTMRSSSMWGCSGSPVYRGQELVLDLVTTWGDQHYIGLTGIEVIGKSGEVVTVDMDMLDAEPRDLHHLEGHEDDDRTLDKLIDGDNVTTYDEHMWLVPFTDGASHLLRFHFRRPTAVTGLRVWNYNKSAEDTYRGVHTILVYLDGQLISPAEGFLIRKGPGNCYFDFAQQVMFGSLPTVVTRQLTSSEMLAIDRRQCEFALQPRGFIYLLQLLSSWGDPYYIGLNGIELFDSHRRLIILTESNIAAYPDSVNVLSRSNDITCDVRTPDKLIDGVNDTRDSRHMWLAPILPNVTNRVYIIFDEPVELSMMRIWNYGKTTSRGVRDVALLVDDLLVYSGTLSCAPEAGRSHPHTVVFSDDDPSFHDHTTSALGLSDDMMMLEERPISLMNDRNIVASAAVASSSTSHHSAVVSSAPADPALRPMTSVPSSYRSRRRDR